MCGGVRYWHPPRILAPTFCRRSSPLSTPHTAAFKRYDSFNDRDFVEKSDFQNLGFKLYWLDILLHPVLCGIFWLEKLRFYSKITDQLIVCKISSFRCKYIYSRFLPNSKKLINTQINDLLCYFRSYGHFRFVKNIKISRKNYGNFWIGLGSHVIKTPDRRILIFLTNRKWPYERKWHQNLNIWVWNMFEIERNLETMWTKRSNFRDEFSKVKI